MHYHIGLNMGQPGIPLVLPDLKLWLDASDLGTIVHSSGAVSQWSDKSGNANHATNAGAASTKPTTGAATQNGLNVIGFDGDDTMALSSGIYSIANGPSTIFCVSKRTSEDGTIDTVIAMGEGNSNRYFVIYNAASGSVGFRANNTTTNPVASTGNTNTNWQIIRGRRSGTTQAISINNAAETTNTNGADEGGIDEAVIGNDATGTLPFVGSLAEILIYSRSLSAAEMTLINNYLDAKWAIP